MAGSLVSSRVLLLGVAVLLGLLIGGLTPPAEAHRSDLAIEIVSEQATISPDGRTMTFDLATTCDMKANIVTAQVTVAQGQSSGQASFTPRCARLSYGVRVTVPALSGSFQTGGAQVSAVLAVQQGKTKEARDSASLRARPSVSVVLADEAVLDAGAVLIDVTVTCPPTSAGRGGEVRVYDGRVVGVGTFAPAPCDGLPNTASARVAPPGGAFQAGSAEAFAFASIEEGGDIISSADFRTILIREP